MKGKGRTKTFILRKKRRGGRGNGPRGRESTILKPETINQLRAQFANQPGSSSSFNQYGQSGSKLDLILDDSDEEISQMIDMSFDQHDIRETLNQSLQTIKGGGDLSGNNIDSVHPSMQNLIDLNESDRSIVKF